MSGRLTFKKEDRSDTRWRLKEEIILGELEREAQLNLYGLVHSAEVAAAQYVEQKIYDYHHGRAEEAYGNIERLSRPYAVGRRLANAKQEKELFAIWADAFGDPDDPEVKASIERTVSELRKRRDAAET